MNALRAAHKANIHEVTIIGHHMVGISEYGGLYKWHGTRWVRLEVAVAASGKRRPYRYSGHHDARQPHA